MQAVAGLREEFDAMFERLEGQFGTTHAYLDEALGVDAAMRAQIADRLLEPA